MVLWAFNKTPGLKEKGSGRVVSSKFYSVHKERLENHYFESVFSTWESKSDLVDVEKDVELFVFPDIKFEENRIRP